MKIIPIKVELTSPRNFKFIEWKIHNVCNYDCSFCGSENKQGDQRWMSIDDYKKHVDRIAAISQGSDFFIQITGGEPTLYPKLIELLRYIKSLGGGTGLISNGSRTIRWWEELKKSECLDYLVITYHSEQTDDYDHVIDVMNVFHNEPTDVVCLITHVIESVDQSIKALDSIVEKTGVVCILKAMMIGSYDIYSLYTESQLKKVKESNLVIGKLRATKKQPAKKYDLAHDINVTYNNGSVEFTSTQTLMKNKSNNFFGWSCLVGNNSMRIDYDVVHRGVCEVGESRSLADDDLNFTNDYITCTRNTCFCTTDLVATKIRVE